MTPGIFKGKPLNWGVTTTNAGDPQATVILKLLVNEETKETEDIIWNGSLKEGKAREITLDALLTMGYRENDLTAFAEAKGLDKEKVVQVTVGEEEYKGRISLRAKFINEVGSGGNKEFMAKNDAVLKLQGLNLGASIMERKITLGIETATPPPGKDIKKEDIPF